MAADPDFRPLPRKILGVLGGRDLAPGALADWMAWADRVVAADQGADLCRAAGREPDKIVGDLDSITDATGLTPDPDQETSDADKLLDALREEAEVTLIGVEGDRLDHVLSTLYSCARATVRCRLILRRGTAFVLRAPEAFEGAAKGRVSVMPLGPCRVTLRGVQWPLEDIVLDPRGRVSISNQMAEDRLRLTMHDGAAVLFLEGVYEVSS